MAKPILIYLLPESPWPPTSGGRLHAANLVEVLREQFDVYVLSLDETVSLPAGWVQSSRAIERRRLAYRARLSDSVAAAVYGSHVLLERALRSGLVEAYNDVLQAYRPQVVVLGRPFFGPFIHRAREIGARVVIDADEDLGQVARAVLQHGPTVWARARALVDLLSAPRLQRRDYRKADQVWVTSSIEAERFRYLGGLVRVLPNVIECDPDPPRPRDVSAVAFVGWYRYPPNEEAALELIRTTMPLVHRNGGPRVLLLVGRDPTPAMTRAARGRDWVHITGEVPDTRPLIQSAGVFAAPIRSGGGTRMKILEALAAGVPVVSTSLGVSGLTLEPGSDVIVVDTPHGMAEAVCDLAADTARRRRLVDNGWRAVRQHHSKDRLATAARSALLELLGRC